MKKLKIFPIKQELLLSAQDLNNAGWEITAFNLPTTWEHTQGEGVTIAVVDTGCDLDHKNLKNNLLPGINLINFDSLPEDDNKHGSHITGIICAENIHMGRIGIAPASKVIPIKALNRHGNGDLEQVAEGIRWAADQKVDFICMSMGSTEPIQQIKKAINYAEKKGVITFCAAGNSGFSDVTYYPAAYTNTIAVASINENFDISKFSCVGKNIDFFAPGERILSTVPHNKYAVLSGTSMATPWVVGVCALALSYSRSHETIPLKTTEDYKTILRKFSLPLTKKQIEDDRKWTQGMGIVQPEAIIKYLKGNQIG